MGPSRIAPATPGSHSVSNGLSKLYTVDRLCWILRIPLPGLFALAIRATIRQVLAAAAIGAALRKRGRPALERASYARSGPRWSSRALAAPNELVEPSCSTWRAVHATAKCLRSRPSGTTCPTTAGYWGLLSRPPFVSASLVEAGKLEHDCPATPQPVTKEQGFEFTPNYWKSTSGLNNNTVTPGPILRSLCKQVWAHTR